MTSPAVAELNRRSFLKTSVMGGMVLSTGSAAALLTGCAKKPAIEGYMVLREQDAVIIRALAPVILDGALPEGDEQAGALEDLLHGIDNFLAYSSDASQQALGQLFDLLSLPPARILTTGLWSDWTSASQEELTAFLARWQSSSVGLFRAGYLGLAKLITASWYVIPRSWATTGYVAPVREI